MNSRIINGRNLCKTVPLLLLSICFPLAAQVKILDLPTVYREPPTPQEIANILFPPKVRSINPDESAAKASPVFGMVINFEFDSANILPESEPMLQALGNMMNIDSVSDRSIIVEGHTDASGSASYNQKLSEKRANAIKNFLVHMHSISPERLITVGKGETDLYLRSKPRAAINRRATFRPAP